jgi:tetratricopeptide (TPR) repeat protein
MQRAYRLDGVVEMGHLGPEVARYLFDNEILEPLLPLYRHLLAGEGGTPRERQRWRFRLGLALEGLDLPEAALREYRTYWKEWDWETGSWNPYVVYRHATVLFELADERAARGDAEGALALVDEVLDLKAHREHRIEARYRKGLYLEQLGRVHEALGWYEKVAEEPAGEAGLAEDARERIEALRATGVH